MTLSISRVSANGTAIQDGGSTTASQVTISGTTDTLNQPVAVWNHNTLLALVTAVDSDVTYVADTSASGEYVFQLKTRGGGDPSNTWTVYKS